RALEEIRAMLLAKNQAYGDSALNPVRVFSQASSAEQIRVRIDDKISRLVRGQAAGEDTAADLLGYLILLRMAEARDRERAEWESSPAASAGQTCLSDQSTAAVGSEPRACPVTSNPHC